MSELDPLDKRLDMAWRALSPPDELAARVRARLSSAGGVGAAATLGGRVASRWRALRASGPLGAGLAGLILGVGVALGYLIPRAPIDAALAPEIVAQSSVAQPSAPPPALSPSAIPPPSAPLPSPPPSPPPSRSVPSASPRPRASRPLPRSTHDSAAELSLLERAERAVRAKNPALALALIAELEQHHPRSPLHEERRSIELMARCQAEGAGKGGDARLETFGRRYPESVYSARIAAECGDPRSPAPLTNGAAPDIDGVEGDNNVQ